MRRLFVAIRPPEPIRSVLLTAMGGVSAARWQSDDQIHLTVRFIGEVDRHQARDIDATLAAIHHPRFEIRLDGIGTFGRRDHPDTVWAGIAPHEPVKRLHEKVDRALERVGFTPEQRAYMPHITLARLKRSSGPVGGLLERSGGLRSAPFLVDSFTLYESRLTPEGAAYTPVNRYQLD